MSRFTDTAGRDWLVEITTVEIKRCRAELDVDLLDVGNSELYDRLTNDQCLIVDVLHVCCREQCAERDVDAVGFARALRGDVLDAAVAAFQEAWIAFFPNRRRQVLAAALANTNLILTATSQHALQIVTSDRMDQFLAKTLQEIDRSFEQTLTNQRINESTNPRIHESTNQPPSAGSSPNGPPSPASAPATASPSANSPGAPTPSSASAGAKSPGSPPAPSTPTPAEGPSNPTQ